MEIPDKTHQRVRQPSKGRRRFLVSVLGALTVLVTFMVREALREHQKEIADGISSAELLYRVEELSLHFDTNVDSLQNHLYGLSQYMSTKGRQQPGIDFASDSRPREVIVFYGHLIERTGDGAKSNISSSRKQLDMIQPLMDQLPDSQREKDKYRSLQEELTTKSNQFAQFDQVIEEAENTDDMASVTNMTDRQAFALADKRKEQETHLRELENNAGRIAEASGSLVEEIINAAKMQKYRAERKYASFTNLSFVLYPLGVLIALIGQYYGEEVVEVGNE